MANILVTLTKTTTPLPGTQVFASTVVAVTDSAGAVQSQTLTGVETPAPWAATFPNLAAGAGSVTATDTDSTGSVIGASAVTQTFNTGGTGGGGTFPATTGIVVTAA
jgi:hypothetical protein